MALKQIDYGTNEYDQMIALRHEILRKPLGITFSKEELDKDKYDILIACMDDEEVLGCCILTHVDNNCIRLRQMAVQKKLQGKGIGESIMTFAENLARDKGYKTLMMHARDTAIGFYEKFGYAIKGEKFTALALNNMTHQVMEKMLW
ncbi:MAG: GNAT family N-acetyltransferase [Sphingobacteriales bacterium]|nr:GNAT family N-acetyltransferase [Sphingobacteriales bacterium]